MNPRHSQSHSVAGQTLLRLNHECWLQLWHAFFYLQLFTIVGLTLYFQPRAGTDIPLLLTLSLLLGIYYALCVMIHITYWHRFWPLTALYLALGWGLWLVLATHYPFYWLLIFSLCSQIYLLLSGLKKIPGIVLLSSLALWQIIVATGVNFVVILFFIGSVFIGLITAFQLERMHQQNQEKDRLLRELAATRKELAEAERQAGAAQERQHLAHEIHDTLAQGFSSIIMRAESASSALSEDDREAAQRHLDQICRMARENLVEARRLMWALQPESEQRIALPEVLAQVTRKWLEENLVPAETTITGSPRTLRPEVEVTVLRAAQEGLANVRKHAQAKHVTVTLSFMDDMVVLDIQDDGNGFDPAHLPLTFNGHSGGFGLKALRERAEHLGGSLSVESTPGEGTTLVLSLPALPGSAH